MLIKLSTWSSNEVRTQDEVIVKSLITVPLIDGTCSNIWENNTLLLYSERN